MSNEGMNRMARVLQSRMQELGDKPSPFDYGEILGDMSLKTNKFPLPIPQRDYMICRSVQWGDVGDIFYKTQDSGSENSGEHGHGPNGQHPHGESGEHDGHIEGDGAHAHPDSEGTHTHEAGGEEMKHVHDTLIGTKFRWLKPGDRVLVAWVGDDDACVIDIV
jgi:hypothetical protein